MQKWGLAAFRKVAVASGRGTRRCPRSILRKIEGTENRPGSTFSGLMTIAATLAMVIRHLEVVFALLSDVGKIAKNGVFFARFAPWEGTDDARFLQTTVKNARICGHSCVCNQSFRQDGLRAFLYNYSLFRDGFCIYIQSK